MMMQLKNAASSASVYLELGFNYNIDDLAVDRNLHDANPKHDVTTFGTNSSTGTLHRHLKECHLAVWVEGCDKLGIEIMAKGVQAAIDKYQQHAGKSTGYNQTP